MGRLYDAYVEVGPRFAGFGDIKKQGDRAGREYGKALADAAAKAAAADVRKLGEALAKARSGEADAAGKVRVAEAKLEEVRKNSKARASQLAAAEEELAAAQRKSAAAAGTAKDAAESLSKAQKRVADLAESGGKNAGGRFSSAFKSGLLKLNGDREGKQFATRFGVGMNGAIGGIVSRSAGVFVAGFAAIKSAEVFGSFINDARESAKVARVSAQVVQSTGAAAKITAAQMGDLATAISNKTGADDEDVQSGENLLATFTNVRNEVGKGNDIFNRATQAAVDMASAMNNGVVDANGLKAANIQLGKALNDPVKGVTALQKVGVSFTADQKKQIKTLVDSGNTLAAQKIILAEVGKEFGGAAAAASDPMTKLGVIAGNAKEAIGGAFLPIVDKVASSLGKFIPDAVSKASTGLSALGAAFKGEGVTSDGFVGVMERIGVAARTAFDFFKTDVLPRLREFGSFVVSNVVPAAQNLVAAFTPLAQDIGHAVVAAFEKLAPAVQSLGGFLAGALPAFKNFTGFLRDNKTLVGAVAVGIGAMVLAFKAYQGALLVAAVAGKAYAAVQAAINFVMDANPIGIVVLAVVGLAAGLVYAYKHSEKFRDVVNGAFGAVKSVVGGAIDGIKAAVGGVVTAFTATKNAIGTAIGAVGTAFGAVKNAVGTAVQFIGRVWNTVVTAVSGPVNAVIGVLQAVWSRISPILVLPFYIAKKSITSVFTGIQVVFSTVAGWVKGVFSKAWNAVTGVLAGPVNAAKRGLDKVWAGITLGFNLVKGFAIGAFAKAWAAVKTVLSVPVRGAKTTLDTIWSGIKAAFNAVKSFATGAFSKAWTGLKTVLTTPITLAKNAITTILSAGKGGLRWVFSQAVSGISTIWNGLQTLAKKPIRFIIDTVLNKGLIDGFNWIAGKFDAPTIKHIPLPKGFADGGRIPGMASAVDNTFGMHKGNPIPLATGEFIVNARQTQKHLPLLRAINDGAQGYAHGGLLGSLKGAVTGAYSKGKNLVGDVADFTKDAAGWLKKKFSGPLDKLKELGDSAFAKIVTAVPRKIGDTIVGKAKDLLKGVFGAGAGPNTPVGKVVNFRGKRLNQRTIAMLLSAEAQLGKTFHITQGSYSTSVAASGSTHAGGGAMDTDDARAGWLRAQGALRAAGFAAWWRHPWQGPWGNHIHSIAIGDPTASPAAKAQVRDFQNGGDGLGGRALGGRIGVYDRGGRWPSGTIGVNTSGKTETVIPGDGTVELSDRSLRKLAALLADRPITLDGRRVDAAVSGSAISRGYR